MHLGFGVFMKNEHKCETETKRLQSCCYAEVTSVFGVGSACVLSENNATIKTLSNTTLVKSFKIRPITESDGAQCFKQLGHQGAPHLPTIFVI